MTNWDPDRYLVFATERTQPAIDLASRVRLAAPRSIVDLGCGPGTSTEVLRRRWPGADVTGVDNSPEMLAEARARDPRGRWVLADIATFEPDAPVDLVFSNAALQWLPDHDRLLPRLFATVAKGGALAVQVPAGQDGPLARALAEVSAREEWRETMRGAAAALNYSGAVDFYRRLAAVAGDVEVWDTTYYHKLDTAARIIEWYRATGLRPYLSRLRDEQARVAFEQELLRACAPAYPPQPDGKLLLPFRRAFAIAYRHAGQ